jgi:hypothetical protein
MVEERKLCEDLMGKLEGRRPLRRLRHRWKGAIKMEVRESGREGVEWIHLTWYGDWWWALVNMVMNLHVLALQS